MRLLPWIVLLAPFCSALIIVTITQRSRAHSSRISVTAVAISFLAALIVCLNTPASLPQFMWLDFGPQLQVPIGLTIDSLSKLMLMIVTGIGLLIHVYSLGYMHGDDGASRYFAGLSLFMFSMLGIVLANNFVMMFIFWELVGVSSYLLIGHWFYRPAPSAAANKAFITNRIGDFGFMLGILMVWLATGSVVFGQIQERLEALTADPAYLTVTCLLIFCGAAGKSAQFPLHVWLPDAMEGPTPVSALIHAATMVAAGVYMLARTAFLFAPAPTALNTIAWIGISTSVLAALMATQQNDIKRILAYSTLSQLGYMIMATGLASSGVAMFHLYTHAFFKALLFLGAGSVIHSLHHEQDIWHMGGLKNKMPVTFLTFLLGTLALTGCPFLSGFYSKDAILAVAFEKNRPIFFLTLFVAFLTAFYMFRLFVVVFLAGPRSDSAKRGHEGPAVMTIPLIILAIPSVVAGYGFIAHRFVQLPAAEHGWAVPLMAFAAFAIGGLAAYFIYYKRQKDPISVPLFARKFYFDEIYTVLIRSTQDFLALVFSFFDRLVVDLGGVRGTSGGVRGLGFILSLFQVGNLQAYAFLFGAGIIGLIYLFVFRAS